MKSSFFCTFLFILLTSLLTLCCQGRHQANVRSIEQTMELAQTDADSALQLLQGMDRTTFSNEETALFSLAYALVQNKSGLDVNSDSMIRVAYNYYNSRPHDKHYGRCMYFMGKYYLLVDSTEKAIDCCKEAEHASRELQDTAYQCFSMEILCRANDMHPHLALQYAQKAARLYRSYSKATQASIIASMLNESKCYSACGNNRKAIEHTQTALRMSLDSGDSAGICASYQVLSSLYNDVGRSKEALSYALLACKYASPTKKSVFLNLADCYMTNKKYEECYQLLDTLKLDHKEQWFLSYSWRMDIAFKQEKYPLMLDLAYSAIGNLNSMYVEAAKDKEAYYASSMSQVRQTAYAQGQAAEYQNILLLQLLVSILVVSFFILICRSRAKSIKQRVLSVKDAANRECEFKLKDKDAEVKLHESAAKKYEAEAKKQEEEAKRQEAEAKKYEAEAKKHEREIQEYQEAYEQLKNILLQKNKALENLKKADTTPHLQLSDEEWKDVEDYLNITCSNFVVRIRESFVGLKEKDFRFLMLLKLQMSAKVIASIYGISEKSIRQKCYVYKEKIGLNVKTESLRDYIFKF